MSDFIKQSSYAKIFYSNNELGILHVGYDDFNVVEPSKTFRMQNFYTWHFIISGKGTLEIYDKQYKIKNGDMFFIPPNTKMRYYPDKENPWEYVWFAFKDEQVLTYSHQVGFTKENPTCGNPNHQKVNHLFKKLFTSLIENECGYFSVLATFYQIMDILIAHPSLTEIQQLKKLLDENVVTPNFSVEQFCRDIGISHAHLLRLFKNAYQTTLIKYISHKRIELARELLVTTDLSVSSVAFSCGFSDELHFMKTFKKTTGKSALQYRKGAKNKAET